MNVHIEARDKYQCKRPNMKIQGPDWLIDSRLEIHSGYYQTSSTSKFQSCCAAVDIQQLFDGCLPNSCCWHDRSSGQHVCGCWYSQGQVSMHVKLPQFSLICACEWAVDTAANCKRAVVTAWYCEPNSSFPKVAVRSLTSYHCNVYNARGL